MSVVQRQSHSHAEDPLQQLACEIDRGLEAATGRYEPQSLASHRVPTDPYVAWVAQREAGRDGEERARVRWVYRYPGAGATKVVS